ncbi:MAG: hypothetical protein WBM41_08750 [Arenicellales bacterium]
MIYWSQKQLLVAVTAGLFGAFMLQISVAPAVASNGKYATGKSPYRCTPSNRPRLKLLFLSNRPGGALDGNYDLYRANLDGSEVVRITDFPDYSVRWFDRDINSGRLVVAASSDGDLSVGPSGHHGGAKNGEQAIAILAADSTMRFLVDIRHRDSNPEKFVGVWHPTFSPDGQRIVYAGTKHGQSANIWIQNTDGSGLRRLIDDPHRTHQDPRFTADGRIVFVRHDKKGLGQLTDPNGLNIWIMDPDEPSSARPVVNEDLIAGSSRVETDPAMSPDCAWIISIRAAERIGLRTIFRPASDNVIFPVIGIGQEPIRVLQKGVNPLRVHGVPSWIDSETLLSYRWEAGKKGWRVIRYRIDAKDGDVEILDLGAPVGAEDLLPLAY